ncbi:YqiA/YcfP family alpha/beta fold hydrolase [Vibrio alginolyticus]
MIIYLHGFDSTSPGNHEKVLQLQFIDDDVRFINYSTLHPKHDMQHLLKEVSKVIDQSDDPNPLICGVGLGGYWSERIGFLCGIKQVMFNPTCIQKKRWLVESIAQKSTKISQQNVLISSERKIKLTA